ncbi:MAG: hypothetical protein HY902_01710 [Deltaproteobacteria bacterium]|nr:hypothetical protein [Deltaproteobacteria bacterium]
MMAFGRQHARLGPWGAGLAVAAHLFGCGGTSVGPSEPAAAHVAHAGFGVLTPRELWQRLRDGRPIRVFDNNRPETYALGRVPGAISLALDAVSAERLPVDRDITVVFYCSNEH